MKNKNKKKVLAALICLSSFMATSTVLANEDNEPYIKDSNLTVHEDGEKEEYQTSEQEEIHSEESTSEEKEETYNLEKVRVPVVEYSEKENLKEDEENLEEASSYDEENTLDISDEVIPEKVTSEENNEEKLPVVYYDDSNLDDVLKKYPDYVKESVKPTGEYTFVNQGESTYVYGKDGKLLGEGTIVSNDKLYKTDSKGRATTLKNTWGKINDDFYRADSKGTLLKGFNKVNNTDYYFENTGILLRNAFINQDRTIFRADNTGALKKAKNTWANIGSKTFLTDNNAESIAGKRNVSGTNYYFSRRDGLARNKEVLADGGRYWANEKGVLSFIKKEKGWQNIDGLNFLYQDDGNLSRGLTDSGYNRYFFDLDTGEMLRNQIQKKGFDRIYIANNGVANYIGWDYYNGKLSFYRENGTFAKGLSKIDGVYYGFDDNGRIYDRQYKKYGNQWWYFNKFGEASRSNGSFARGWVGNRFYFADGKPAEGLQKIDGKTYIFHERTREKIRNDIKVVNFVKYRLDGNGVATPIGKIDTRQAIMGTRGQFQPGFTQYLNRKTPYFRQVDPRWSYRPFSAGTLGEYGCGPTVMAMVLNRQLHRNDIYPTNTAVDASDYDEYGTDWQYFKENPRIYGLNSYDVTINKKALIQALEFGSVVMRVGAGYYTTGGHYIVIDSYKDGYFTINDPYSVSNTMEKQPFWRIKQEATVAWVIKK